METTNMKLPSEKEIWKFMSKMSKPYRFEYVKDSQPLRVSIERKTIYVNRDVLMATIKDLVDAGLDWRGIMTKDLWHEKAHEKFYKWNLQWNVDAAEYGWLASFITDIVIDKIHFGNNSQYQKWLLAESRCAFEGIRKDIWSLFPTVSRRPHFLYNQAAYWVAINAIRMDEAANLYPEKADYIVELSHLFNKVKNEQDLEWAFPEAKKIYLKNSRPQQTKL